MSNLAQWSAIVAFFVPIVMALLNQTGWPAQLKAVLFFAVSLVAAGGTAYFQGDLTGKRWLDSALIVVPWHLWSASGALWRTAPFELLWQVLWQGVLIGCIALVALNHAIARLGPERASALVALVPALSAILGLLFLGESLSNAEIVAHDNGTVTLLTMAADIGQGSDTVLTQICAEVLGLRMEDVKLVTADTELTPIDAGSWGSRVTFMAGHAVLRAAEDVKRDLFEAAAQRLNILVTDVLEAKDGHIYLTRKPERRISFADAVAAAQIAKGGRPVIGRGSYTPKGKGALLPAVSFGAQVAEVEVDRETGQVKVLKLTTAHDCGVALNPTAVEGQIDGGIHMALGQALSEQMVTDRGEPVNTTFLDYKIFSALDMPKAETIAVETYEPEGPFGAKEASEGLAIPTVPAIANAICNATGVRVKGLPITPEKLLWALREKEGA